MHAPVVGIYCSSWCMYSYAHISNASEHISLAHDFILNVFFVDTANFLSP